MDSKEKNSLKECFKNTENLDQTVFYLECVLKNHTPFALYIATSDRKDCMWIFDTEMIYDMVGGESKYISIKESVDEEESSPGVLFFVFKKIGPLYVVKVDLEVIDEIVEELYNEL